MLRKPSPALVLSLVALFFALGGSAFAISQKVKPQGRCQAGAVRGIAIVTGQPSNGIGNVPDQFTTDRSFFGYSWNCTGGTVAIRRVPSTPGSYEIRFTGNAAAVAVGSTLGGPGGAISVQPIGPGTFRLNVFGSENGEPGASRFAPRADLQFSVVAF
jgi:hypothetical protein